MFHVCPLRARARAWSWLCQLQVERRRRRAAAAYRSLATYEQEAKRQQSESKIGNTHAHKTPVATWPQVNGEGTAPKDDDSEPAADPKRAPLSRDKAAKAANVSGRTVARYKRLTQQAPDLAAKVDAGVERLIAVTDWYGQVGGVVEDGARVS